MKVGRLMLSNKYKHPNSLTISSYKRVNYMRNVKFSLNASTLFPFDLDVINQIKVAAHAGYDGIELWVKDIQEYLVKEGSIKELINCMEGGDLVVVDGFGFVVWSVAV